MRKILFKAKRKDNGEWVEGAYFCLHHNDERKHLHHFIIPNNTDIPKSRTIGEIQVEVDPETLCQYTGLTDRNGNRICENDIVRVLMFRGGKILASVGFIEWVNGAFSITWKDKEYGRHFAGYVEGITVIGNIFDNPDLLEGKE